MKPTMDEFWERVNELEEHGVAPNSSIAIACEEFGIDIDDIPELEDEEEDEEGRVFFWGVVACIASTMLLCVMIYKHYTGW
jgi:hypothetical protein